MTQTSKQITNYCNSNIFLIRKIVMTCCQRLIIKTLWKRSDRSQGFLSRIVSLFTFQGVHHFAIRWWRDRHLIPPSKATFRVRPLKTTFQKLRPKHTMVAVSPLGKSLNNNCLYHYFCPKLHLIIKLNKKPEFAGFHGDTHLAMQSGDPSIWLKLK